MKSTVVDESLSSYKPMYCSREYQTSTRLNQQYEKSTLNDVISPVAVSHSLQTPLDELILPPTLVPKLQMETTKPSTTISIPYHPPRLEPSTITTTNVKTGPVSLKMFNHTATDLNEKGIINLKNYNMYLYKKSKPI